MLEPGEDHTCPRVLDTLNPSYATEVHGRWEFSRETVTEMPGGADWLADLDANYDERDHPWVVHEGHMIAVSDRDRVIVAQAGPAILQSGWTGDAASVSASVRGPRAAGGITELVFGPTGQRRGAASSASFAAAVRG